MSWYERHAGQLAGTYEALPPEKLYCWLDDRLPELAATLRLDLAFDLVPLSAVSMHLTPADRPRALRKLVT